MYDFFENVGKRYDKVYSYGGKVERSFWKNVGDIVNKRIENKDKTVFEKILKIGDNYLYGDGRN